MHHPIPLLASAPHRIQLVSRCLPPTLNNILAHCNTSTEARKRNEWKDIWPAKTQGPLTALLYAVRATLFLLDSLREHMLSGLALGSCDYMTLVTTQPLLV